MASITVTPNRWNTLGHQRRVSGTLHLSTSYTTGGDSFTAALFGLGTLDDLVVTENTNDSSTGLVLNVDFTNLKIQAFGTAGSASGLTEIASMTDLHTIIFNFEAFGV